MKTVKLKFYYELAKVLLALLLGAGAGFTTILTSENVTVPNKGLLLLALVILMAVLAFGLLFVFLFIYKKIK